MTLDNTGAFRGAQLARAEKLFVLAMLGDDRAVSATYILGKAAYERDQGRQAAPTV